VRVANALENRNASAQSRNLFASTFVAQSVSDTVSEYSNLALVCLFLKAISSGDADFSISCIFGKRVGKKGTEEATLTALRPYLKVMRSDHQFPQAPIVLLPSGQYLIKTGAEHMEPLCICYCAKSDCSLPRRPKWPDVPGPIRAIPLEMVIVVRNWLIKLARNHSVGKGQVEFQIHNGLRVALALIRRACVKTADQQRLKEFKSHPG